MKRGYPLLRFPLFSGWISFPWHLCRCSEQFIEFSQVKASGVKKAISISCREAPPHQTMQILCLLSWSNRFRAWKLSCSSQFLELILLTLKEIWQCDVKVHTLSQPSTFNVGHALKIKSRESEIVQKPKYANCLWKWKGPRCLKVKL